MTPAMPDPIAKALAQFTAPMQIQLAEIRAMIFDSAARTEGVGALTECLKWGQPAYLTEASRSGSTIRLGALKSVPENCAVFFNCQTTLVEGFRTQFGDVFAFEGNRALILPQDAFPRDALALCLQAALTYHRRKR